MEYIECALNKVTGRRGARGRGFEASSDFYGSLFAEGIIDRRESAVRISKLCRARNYRANKRFRQNRAGIASEDLTQSATGTATIMDISGMRYRRQPYVTVMS